MPSDENAVRAIWVEARLVVTFFCLLVPFGFLVDLVSCDFFRLLVTFFVTFPHEGYQNPCLLITFFGLKPQMLQNTVFAVLYILRVFSAKKREAHQRPISLCQANCNPTLLLGLRVLQPPFQGLRFCKPTFLLGIRFLQLSTPFRASCFATQHSF